MHLHVCPRECDVHRVFGGNAAQVELQEGVWHDIAAAYVDREGKCVCSE